MLGLNTRNHPLSGQDSPFYSTLTLLIFLLAALLSLSGCGKAPVYQQQGYVFGTLVEISIAGETEARAKQFTAQIFQDFDRLHHSLHAWKPGTLSRMNGIFEQSPSKAAIGPGMLPIIQDVTRYAEASQGLFNPAIGKLIKLWGFQSDEFIPVRPDAQTIEHLVQANPKMTDIVIEGIEFYSKNPDVKVDLGGYAKGYALDMAAEYLRSQGVKSALINIGGNIMAIGRLDNRPWHVGIQHPRKPGPIATIDLLDGEAIGTSGDYQRYFMLDGKRYCHLIDPRTGYPAQGVQSVTVITHPGPRAGALSDTASKPIFISGVQHWQQAAANMGVQDVMLIDEQGMVYLTPQMQQRLVFVDKNQPVTTAH